jgi:hypothetical protein
MISPGRVRATGGLAANVGGVPFRAPDAIRIVVWSVARGSWAAPMRFWRGKGVKM